MSNKPYRLAQGGSRIDRSAKLTFAFDGKQVPGFAGDTVASAVLASGQRVFGRSFKYHRPRGVVGLGSEEMNALVGVGDGARHEPNLRATQVELYDGLTAVSQNRWPSLSFDVGALNNKFSRFFPGGFYYKTFMWPKSFWKHVYEPFIRRAAGLGHAPEGRDPDTYEQIHVHCDVLVVGAGVAGLAAARAAAATGKRVIIADENPLFGGLADIAGGSIDGKPQIEWAREKALGLAEAPNVHVLTRTTAVGHWHHNHLMLFERVADHDPALLEAQVPRHRLWKVRAGHVILATGAIERPIAFANNDRPGIMLASAARAMVERYGVSPGAQGIVFTNNDDAYLTALALKKAGVGVRVVDSRGTRRGRAGGRGAGGGDRRGGEFHRLGGAQLAGRPWHHRCQGFGLPQGPGAGHNREKSRLRFHRHVGRLEPGAASVVPQWRQDQIRRGIAEFPARPPPRPDHRGGCGQRHLRAFRNIGGSQPPLAKGPSTPRPRSGRFPRPNRLRRIRSNPCGSRRPPANTMRATSTSSTSRTM